MSIFFQEKRVCPPEHSTEGAVVLSADLADNLVHAPAIQVSIRQHLQPPATTHAHQAMVGGWAALYPRLRMWVSSPAAKQGWIKHLLSKAG